MLRYCCMYPGLELSLVPALPRRSDPNPQLGNLSVLNRCNVIRLFPAKVLSFPDEQELCTRARAGSRAAMGMLLERHGPRLYRSVLLPRLGSEDTAQDALSITYSKVVERFHQFQWQEVGVYPWLRTVALRVALDLLRTNRREVLFTPKDIEYELQARSTAGRSPEEFEECDLAAARQRVTELLGKIHPRYAEAIQIRVLEGRSREQCAETLGVTPATFDVVLHRALVALRKLVNTLNNETL